MKIAIISDIHENFHNIVSFFKQIEDQNIEQVICLGDLINNGIAKVLASSPIPVFMVWGNNDGDKVAITKTSFSKGSNLTVGFSTFDTLEYANRKIFLTHYPMLAKPMAKSGDFDVVFYGHDHEKNIDIISQCLIVNPGEVSGHKTGNSTYAIYDTETNTAELINIKDNLLLKSELADEYRKNMNFTYSKAKSHKY